MLETWLATQMGNQMLIAGAGTVLLGALVALLRNAPAQFWRFLQRRVITTVDITDHDAAFGWIQVWLGQHEYTLKSARVAPPAELEVAAE